jgi:hypothetical protein
MNLHPDVWLALAHQRHDDLLNQARVARLAAVAHAGRVRTRLPRHSGHAGGGARPAAVIAQPAC